jgi:hypothetical protein
MPSKPKLADPGALIRGGKLRTDEFRVCMDPDLVDEYERLIVERDEAKEAARDSLAGGSVAELDAQISELLDAMGAATVPLVLKGLPRPQWRAMLDRHPPRKDAEGKNLARDILGFNYEAFFDELIRASLVSPVLDEETLTLLLDERLTDAQWEALTNVVWGLNRTAVDVPFSPAVSASRRNSSRK